MRWAAIIVALVAAGPALADMYPDASNAKLPEAIGNLGLRTPAACDGKLLATGSITVGTTAFTGAGANFEGADQGKVITIAGAGTTQSYMSATVAAGGAGYAPGDKVTLAGGTGNAVTVVVLATSAGVVTEVTTARGDAAIGAYTVPPANPVGQASSTGAGTGLTLNVTWARNNLVTTIASVGGPDTVTLSHAATATVSGALFGFGTDYTVPISAGLAAGARLPAGVCGHTGTLTVTDKQLLTGEGAGQAAHNRTSLMWLGLPGGTQVQVGSGTDVESGITLGNFGLDGMCSAAIGVKNYVTGSEFPPVFTRQHRQMGMLTETPTGGAGMGRNNFYNWQLSEGQACATNSVPLVFSQGAGGGDTYLNKFFGLTLSSIGTAFLCWNADSNRFYSLETSASSVGIDYAGNMTAGKGCRSDYIDYQGVKPVKFRGTEAGWLQPSVRTELRVNEESGTVAITKGTGASYFGYKMNGRPIGDSSPANITLSGLNPTGNATSTTLMMGLGGTLTSTRSGVIMVSVSGRLTNNTVGDGVVWHIRYGTGAAPANGAAAVGTGCSSNIQVTAVSAAGATYPTSATCVISVAPFATYWFDIGLANVTGGLAALAGGMLVAAEF